MVFRVNARSFFLTYPQCPLAPSVVAENIPRPYQGVLAVREKHEDGNFHIHVLVTYGKKFDCRNERQFDVDGFHPNITAARSVPDCEKYCKKDNPTGDDIFEYGTIGAKSSIWAQIVSAETAEEVHAMVKREAPREYVLSYDRVCNYAETKKFKAEEYVSEHSVFILPEVVQAWVRDELKVSSDPNPNQPEP